MAFLAFALPLLSYLLWPSCLWNFDGVACAAALELGNPVFFFHSNHLLYGFLGYGFWKLIAPLGLHRALPALQLFTSLLAAGGLAGVYKTLVEILMDETPHPSPLPQGAREVLDKSLSLRATEPLARPPKPGGGEGRGCRVRVNEFLALMIVLVISVTAVFWVWSLEAQVYALGFAAIAWATYWLLRADHPHHGRWAGLLHALAVLGHAMHVLWVFPALYRLRRDNLPGKKIGRQNLKEYVQWLSVGVIVPYVLVIGFVILPHARGPWLGQWLLGSAALGPGRTYQWHFPGGTGPYQWALTSLHVFWGSLWPCQNQPVPGWCWALTGVSALGFAVVFVSSFSKRHQPVWRFSLLWLAAYGLFFWTWEPGTECYRMTDAVPIAILMALGLRRLQYGRDSKGVIPAKAKSPLTPPFAKGGWGGICAILLLLLVFSTGFVNFATRIYPMTQASRNALYQQTMGLSRSTPENSLYLTEGGQPWIYLLYFTGRPAWNIRSFAREPIRLERAVAVHRRHAPVYIQTSALQAGFIQSWLSRYKLQRVEGGLPWVQLQ